MANRMEHKKTDCGPDFSGIKHTSTKLNKGAMVMLQDCDYQMPQQEYLFSGQVALVTFLKKNNSSFVKSSAPASSHYFYCR